MAGYSKTPLVEKLGIKRGHVVAFVGAPVGFALDGVSPAALRRSGCDVVILFAMQQKSLVQALSHASGALIESGNLWIAWPRKSSGVPTDLSENRLRELILPTGLVDNKVCAIDRTWSGLRFCKRLKDRKK
jgi:hypothetical protein